jgi:hypothetical protein
VCTASCATPRAAPLPTLPPPIDLGALLEPAPPPLAVPAGARRYDERPIKAGQCGVGSPPGILVSPAVYAELVGATSDAKRLRLELAATDKVRRAERQAALDLETACRARAAELEVEVARAERLATWKVAAALVAGGLVGLATGFAMSKPVVR